MPWCACCYPLRGLIGFVESPELYKELVIPFVASILFVFLSLGLLFEFSYEPQVDDLPANFPHWVRCTTAAIAVIFEAMILTLVMFAILFAQVQDRITKAALRKIGTDEKLSSKYGVNQLEDMSCICSISHSLLFLCARLPLMLATLPLLSYPVVGEIAWPLANGWLYAWELLGEILPYIGRKACKEQGQHVVQHRWAYFSFGFAAMCLELIPFVGIIFMAGNAYGAAILYDKFIDEDMKHESNRILLKHVDNA